MSTSVSPKRRAAAVLALVAYVAALVLLLVLLWGDLLALLGAWIGALIAAGAVFATVTRRGVRRILATVIAVLAVIAIVVILITAKTFRESVLFVVALAIAVVSTRYALAADPAAMRERPPPGRRASRPHHPVLLMNPKSGGGKVEKFDLVAEAERRGIEAVVLAPGDDLEQLARAAVERGADVLGMAGGDGSQALVASIAVEHGLPYVCIPAGTRNHLALDLGVDRDDVVGALDAYADGYERRIDLGRVAGRVFVNNVSLGVYARIVQSDAYRDNKLGTVTDMLPDLLGPGAPAFDLAYDNPNGGTDGQADLMLVSNNRYRLDRLGGLGSRPRIDTGKLAVLVVKVRSAAELAELVAFQTAGNVSKFRGYQEWEATSFEVRSGSPIEAGVDGEALRFDSPLRFEILPSALRVRVAPHHPGYSPAAIAEAVQHHGIRGLIRVAVGRDPGGPRRPATD